MGTESLQPSDCSISRNDCANGGRWGSFTTVAKLLQARLRYEMELDRQGGADHPRVRVKLEGVTGIAPPEPLIAPAVGSFWRLLYVQASAAHHRSTVRYPD